MLSVNANKRWSPEEEERLIECKRHNLPTKAIADLLGRTEGAIDSKYRDIIKKLGKQSLTKEEEVDLPTAALKIEASKVEIPVIDPNDLKTNTFYYTTNTFIERFTSGSELVCYNKVNDNVFIILTNTQFIKIEKGVICSIANLSECQFVSHQKNGMFSWDKVVLHNQNRIVVDTFGIHLAAMCAEFIKIIISKFPHISVI